MAEDRIEDLAEAYRSKRAQFEFFAAEYGSLDVNEARRQSIYFHTAETAMIEALIALRLAQRQLAGSIVRMVGGEGIEPPTSSV